MCKVALSHHNTEEVEKALSMMKSEKATGIDAICLVLEKRWCMYCKVVEEAV